MGGSRWDKDTGSLDHLSLHLFCGRGWRWDVWDINGLAGVHIQDLRKIGQVLYRQGQEQVMIASPDPCFGKHTERQKEIGGHWQENMEERHQLLASDGEPRWWEVGQIRTSSGVQAVRPG